MSFQRAKPQVLRGKLIPGRTRFLSMSQFFLIDQSLKGVGGHHFDYSFQVSRAAIQAGWRVTLGTNRKFSALNAFPDCRVCNTFAFTTYAPSSEMVGIQDMVAARKPSVWQKLTGVVRNRVRSARQSTSGSTTDKGNDFLRRDRQKRVHAFRRDCQQCFTAPFGDKDHVFFTTLSDIEAEGLADFLNSRTDSRNATWHLQFHFPLLRGRTPQYQEQADRLIKLRPTFQRLQELARKFSIHFYVTSQTLKDQYDLLGLKFVNLAYPVDPAFHSRVVRAAAKGEKTNEADHDSACRIAVAGAIRVEKNAGELNTLIGSAVQSASDSREQICQAEGLRPLKFLVQKKKPKRMDQLWRYFFHRPYFRRIGKGDDSQENDSSLIERVPFPLPADDYRKFILSADIGLLTTYDSQTYFPRRAGILGEYLSAGIPVIVPAGSWLADQIEPQQQEYLDSLVHGAGMPLQPSNIRHQSDRSTSVEFDLSRWFKKSPTTDAGAVPTAPRFLVLGFRVAKPAGHGHYFRVTPQQASAEATGQQGLLTTQSQWISEDESQIVGQPRDQESRLLAFSLPQVGQQGNRNSSSQMIGFRLENAYPCRQWQVEDVRLWMVRSTERLPRSSVGLIASEFEQTPNLIREMVAHHDHYRQTAMEHAQAWYRQHDPQLTFSMLMDAKKRSGAVDLAQQDKRLEPVRDFGTPEHLPTKKGDAA